MGKNSAPPPPQPTDEERELISKQGKAIDAYLSSLEDQKKQNKSVGDILAISSGLYDPLYGANGELIGSKINPGAVEALKGNIATTNRLATLSAERYEKALKGELPVSEGLIQRKAQDFQLFKEAQARLGNIITGDTPETAAASSTAGIESLNRFQTQYKLLEDQERRGELAMGPGMTPGSAPLSLVGQVPALGPGSVAAGYGNAATLYGGAQQPYQFQRGLEYNSALQTSANKAQFGSDIMRLIGQVGGAAAGAATYRRPAPAA